MIERQSVGLALSIAFALSLAGGVASAADVEWSYKGETGPASWAGLSPSFAACGTGVQQSPIDIAMTVAAEDLPPIGFGYKDTPLVVENNGHTIEVPYETGSSIRVGDATYRLLQFHLHAPSEHTRDGGNAAMEAHFVHKDSNNRLAVVGVLIDLGQRNKLLAPIFDNMPVTKGEVEVEHQMINAESILPGDRAGYSTYSGSLTTPPCSENVRWLVLDERIQVSPEQLDAFKAIFPFNNRPVQPINDRRILEREN